MSLVQLYALWLVCCSFLAKNGPICWLPGKMMTVKNPFSAGNSLSQLLILSLILNRARRNNLRLLENRWSKKKTEFSDATLILLKR